MLSEKKLLDLIDKKGLNLKLYTQLILIKFLDPLKRLLILFITTLECYLKLNL